MNSSQSTASELSSLLPGLLKPQTLAGVVSFGFKVDVCFFLSGVYFLGKSSLYPGVSGLPVARWHARWHPLYTGSSRFCASPFSGLLVNSSQSTLASELSSLLPGLLKPQTSTEFEITAPAISSYNSSDSGSASSAVLEYLLSELKKFFECSSVLDEWHKAGDWLPISS